MADFILSDNSKLSIKTNINNNRKVCPQNIGQISKEKFIKLFGNNNDNIKDLIFRKIAILLRMYLDNTFICEHTVWIYKKNNIYQSKIFNKNFISNKIFDNDQISFSKSLEDWKESITVKYKNVSIGEFQIHSNRNIVKFRFNLDKLLSILDDVYHIRGADLERNYLSNSNKKSKIIYQKNT